MDVLLQSVSAISATTAHNLCIRGTCSLNQGKYSRTAPTAVASGLFDQSSIGSHTDKTLLSNAMEMIAQYPPGMHQEALGTNNSQMGICCNAYL